MTVFKTFQDLTELPFSHIRQFFGGKALGLYEACQLQLPVPPVYLLSTEIYETFTTKHPHLKHEEFHVKAKAYFLTSFLT